MLVSLITLKFQISARNGQIITFELSTVIMRHEVLFYLVTIVGSLLVHLYFHSVDLFRRIVTSFCT